MHSQKGWEASGAGTLRGRLKDDHAAPETLSTLKEHREDQLLEFLEISKKILEISRIFLENLRNS